MDRFLFVKHAKDRAPSGCGPQIRRLCCLLLTYAKPEYPAGEADPRSVVQRTRPIRLRMKGMSQARMAAATSVPIATAPNKRTIAPSAAAS
jgi:hypothetical protein